MAELIPDDELVRMISKADSSAFKYVYRNYYNMVKNMVEKNSGSSDDASDLFQDVVMIIYEKARDEKLRLSCSLKTFIYSIARNQWLKKLGSMNRKVALTNFEEFVVVQDDVQTSPIANVSNLLNEIGEACRKLLILFYFKKRSMEEICLELNYSNSDSVKNQKYKCIQRLRKMVAEKK